MAATMGSGDHQSGNGPGGDGWAGLDRFFELPLDPLCVADASGHFRRLTPSWTDLLGYPLRELEGRPFLDFVHPDDRAATLATLEELKAGRQVVAFVNRYRRSDGECRWVEWRAYPDGGLIYASARDVTERVLTEEALSRNRKRLEDLLSVIGDWIWETDAERRYTDCSEGVRKVLGYAPDEVIGKTPWDFMVPEDAERLRPLAQEEAEKGLGCSELMNRNLHKDGREVVVLTSCLPLFDSAGTLVGFRGVDKDITAAVRAEESLRESVVRLHTLRQIAETVAAPGDVLEALGTVAGQIADMLGARLAMAVVLDEGAEGRRVIASRSAEGEQYEGVFAQRATRHLSIFSDLAKGGAPLVINDVEAGPLPSSMLEHAREKGFSRLLMVPLAVQAEAVGILVVTRGGEAPPFNTQEVELAQAAAGSVAAAVMRGRLRTEERLKAAAQAREHLARELHDAVTQSVYSAGLIAEALPAIWERSAEEGLAGLSRLRRLIISALAELRILLYELRPAALPGVPFSQLLQRLADSLAGQSEADVRVEVEALVEEVLSPEAKVTMYRIAQEALNNIAKHARACRISIVARLDADVVLEIEDDGVGFSPGASDGGAMGLEIMRERARDVGASIEIGATAPAGTRVTVRWAPPAGPPAAGDRADGRREARG